jgi:lactate dehydrogenase-like 2-hydroxyacid dehydrogenase
MTAGQSQRSIIVVHPDFDRTWPWAADHFRVLWEAQGQTEYIRLAPDDRRAVCEIVADPAGVTRLVALNVPVTVECVARMPALREADFSPEPSTGVGARRELRLDSLFHDADIFAPMVPLTDETRGLVKREHLLALPRGCLIVLVTRAAVGDMPTLRERVLADQLALAADVWDVEPLPLDDPLLGSHNVVHTPHNAGRTRDAKLTWAENLAVQFDPPGG